MKKSLFVAAIAAFALVACKKTETADTTVDSTAVTVDSTVVTVDSTVVATDSTAAPAAKMDSATTK